MYFTCHHHAMLCVVFLLLFLALSVCTVEVAEEQQEPEQYEEYNTEEFVECPEPIPGKQPVLN